MTKELNKTSGKAELYTTRFPWTRNLVMRTIGDEGWHYEGEILYGEDVVEAFFQRLDVESLQTQLEEVLESQHTDGYMQGVFTESGGERGAKSSEVDLSERVKQILGLFGLSVEQGDRIDE